MVPLIIINKTWEEPNNDSKGNYSLCHCERERSNPDFSGLIRTTDVSKQR